MIFSEIKKNQRPACRQTGMSYVELIVVLSIFSAISSVALFNYGKFKAKVDVKNLASRIALEIVRAQKSSLSGQLPPAAQQLLITPAWKPSYGIHFNVISEERRMVYFADLNQDGNFSETSCSFNGECLNKFNLVPIPDVFRLHVFYQDSTSALLDDLTIVFVRPDSSAIITSSDPDFDPLKAISYVQITITFPQGVTGRTKVYPSGRIQVN